MGIIGLLGAGLVLGAGGFPPHAGRATPPSGLEERARKPGEPAPPFVLPDAGGGSFALKNALQRGPVALLFYRGSW